MEQQNNEPKTTDTPPPLVSQNEQSGDELTLSSDEITLGMLTHLLGIFTGFLGPLIIWLVKKDEMPFVDKEGKEALNFHITVAIGMIISGMLIIIIIGLFLIPIIALMVLIFGIMGAIQASNGKSYRYPINIRFIK